MTALMELAHLKVGDQVNLTVHEGRGHLPGADTQSACTRRSYGGHPENG